MFVMSYGYGSDVKGSCRGVGMEVWIGMCGMIEC